MRVGTCLPLHQLDQAPSLVDLGAEFIELQAPYEIPQPLTQPPINVPIVWQAPADLPLEHPAQPIRQASRKILHQQLELAQVLGTALFVIQFRRPDILEGKAGLRQLVAQYIECLAPLVQQARSMNIQVVLRNHYDNREQLQILREVMRGVPGLGLAVDVAYTGIGVNKSLLQEFLWDADLAPRLAHLYASDILPDVPHVRLPLGSVPDGINWQRVVGLIKERYNASVTIEAADVTYLQFCFQRWNLWWGA